LVFWLPQVIFPKQKKNPGIASEVGMRLVFLLILTARNSSDFLLPISVSLFRQLAVVKGSQARIKPIKPIIRFSKSSQRIVVKTMLNYHINILSTERPLDMAWPTLIPPGASFSKT